MVHASLFSGIGGPEVAAAMMGWENAFHCEINPFGRAVLEYWFPESKSYEDITKTDFRQWRGKIDIITAGFPCQPFSFAGKRGGDSDERYLWPEAFRVIDEVRPTWFVGENVAGIATMVEAGVLTPMGWEGSLFGEVDGVHRYGYRGTFTIERICRDLEKIGYSVQPMLIPAAAVGAPHRRDRIFFLAHNDADAENMLGNGRSTGYEGESGRGSCAESGDGGRPDAAPLAASLRHEGRHDETKERYWTDKGRQIGQHGSVGASPHADRKGREEPQQPGRGKDSKEEGAGMDDRTERPRRDGNPADSFRKRLETALQRRCDGKEGRDGKGRYALKFTDDAWLEGTWWTDFPTVSPVHSGNDGIPIRLDGITIPFSKWRTESLKAYGNAIAPQVMYRIFQAIEGAE